MRFTAAVCGWFVLAGVAKAEIYSWRDHDGVLHFTNVQAEIPPAYRSAAEVAVSAAWMPKEETPTASACEESPPRRAEAIVVPRPRPASGAGATADLPTGGVVAEGGRVNIQGPLLVTSAPQVPVWPHWLGVPLVTTSFDRGRSRHLTLRQLAEEQRWLAAELGWAPTIPLWPVFAGGPRPPCVAWGTCTLR